MRIYALFKPPKFDNPDKNRAGTLLFGLLWLTLAAFTMLGVNTALFEPENISRALRAVAIVAVFSAISLVLLHRGKVVAASTLFVFQIWFAVTVSAMTGGGMETPAVQGYILVVLAAGLLIGWRWGLAAGLLSTLTQLTITYLEMNNFFSPFQGVRTPLTYLIVYTLISGLAVIFVYYYTSSIRTSLALAKQELAERKRAEQALRESESRMSVFANATFEGITISVDEEILVVNDQLAQMLGYPQHEMLGIEIRQFTAPESLGLIRNNIQKQHIEPYEAFFVRKDGTKFPVEIRGRPIEHHGRLARLSVIRDLTLQKKAQTDLMESERKFRQLLESAPDAMVIVNELGKIALINFQAEQLFGYQRDEILGKSVEVLIPQRYRQHHEMQKNAFYQSPRVRSLGIGYNFLGLRKDGTEFPADISLSPLKTEDGTFVSSSIRDITERRRAEQEIEKTNYQVRERVKELTTLHRVAQILELDHESVQAVLQEIVPILPPGWQYPEITQARIIFDGIGFATSKFALTPWMQNADFKTSNGKTGTLEIAYLEEKPLEEEGPFFTEEKRLINTVAEMLQTYFARREAEQHSQRQLEHIVTLHTIDSAILSSIDLQATLNIIIEHVMVKLGADAADFLLINPHNATLGFTAGQGFRTTAFQQGHQHVGDDFAGEVADKRQLLYLPNITEANGSSARKKHMQKEGFISYLGVPLIAKGEVKGVLEVFHRRNTDVDTEWLDLLRALASRAAIAVDNLGLFQELKQRNLELALAYDVTLEGWSKALDLRDKETEGHSLRVTEMTMHLARIMGLSDNSLAHIRQGALLHDVGKLGIPDDILLKPGKLTEDEWEIMKKHPTYAYEWLSPIGYLRPSLDIPHYHHEKWDGSGYPDGLSGESIPLPARLFAIVDVYDALTSNRPYRKAWSKKKTLEYIHNESGKHFDPQVVKAFVRLINESESDNPQYSSFVPV